MDDVGDHEEPIGGPEQARLLLLEGEQLIERVDLHELQAGGREDLRPRHDRLGGREHAASPRVAVADRIGEQGVFDREEGKIDAPCIDADAGHRPAMPGGGSPQTDGHLVPQPRKIPDQLPPQRNRKVFKPVDLLEFEKPPVKGPRNNPSSGGSQIHRQSHTASHRLFLPSWRGCFSPGTAALRRGAYCSLFHWTDEGFQSILLGIKAIVYRLSQHC
jgi:hypothetical protein